MRKPLEYSNLLWYADVLQERRFNRLKIFPACPSAYPQCSNLTHASRAIVPPYAIGPKPRYVYTIKTRRLSVTEVGVAGWAWSTHATVLASLLL